MPNNRPVHIYALLTPDGETICYVGRSIDPNARHYLHCSTATKDGTPVSAWIHSLRKQGKRPDLLILETTDLNHATEREQYWIDYLSNDGTELLNVRPAAATAPFERTQISTTISPRTRELLESLLPKFGTISAVLTVAVDRLYKAEYLQRSN